MPEDPVVDAWDRLETAVRDALGAVHGGDPAAAPRLACLLGARERFAAIVGARPGGALADLPPPFEDLPESSPRWAPVGAAMEMLRATSCADAAPVVIGDGYETTLADAARGERGQFETPAPVVDALVRWVLDGTQADRPRVLDPAVGTGKFPLAGLALLLERRPDVAATDLLAGLPGVDIDPVALHVAGLRLAAAAGESAPADLPLHSASFFDCEPAGDDATTGAAAIIEPVDAVVGNPPYVRAESLAPDATHYRRHLDAFGPAGESPWRGGDEAISRRADAYVYFVTHATRFLRRGGRLGMVLPTKWLMSAYGEDLRRFLRTHLHVHAVVGFDARAFGDALVDVCLLLAERDGTAVAGEPLRFVRAGVTDADGLLAAVEGESAGGDGRPRAEAVVERRQRALTASGSLAAPLEAPPALLSLLEGPAFVRLDGLAEVARGAMTGANAFFFLDDPTVERHGIEARFLRPAVRSLRWVDRPTLPSGDVERQLLDVHDHVEDVRAARTGDAEELQRAVTDALRRDGQLGLLRYIAAGERAGHHAGRTCRSRPVWFDLGPLRAPAAFVPKLLRERVFCVRNAAGAVPSNAIDGLWPRTGTDAASLVAALNSSAGAAAMEVTGRDEAGLLQLMTYETASLPTLDVRRLDPGDRDRLAAAGVAYAAEPTPGRRAAIDEVAVDVFDLAVGPGTLAGWARRLRRSRVDGGETVAVPLD